MSGAVSWELGRVAGESRLEILLERDAVRVTYGSLLSLRGFERLVVGRRADDVPLIASRICGVCSHAHFWAPALAVEQIAGVEASEDAVVLRDVCNKLQLLQNHAAHLGVLALPDYVDEDASRLLARDTLRLNSHLGKAIRLVCGRLTAPNNYVPGGFCADISSRVLASALEYLRSSRPLLEGLAERVLEVELPELEDPAPNYVALLDHRGGTVPRGQPYCLSTSYDGAERVCVTPENYGELFRELRTEYSTSKKCLFMGRPFYVGARARLLSALRTRSLDSDLASTLASYEGVLRRNPFSNLYAKALESRIVLDSVMRDLSELSSREPRLRPSTTSRSASAGLGVIEAPRGLLIHYYEAGEDRRIRRADVITPTVMNAEHIELAATALVQRLLNEGAGEATIQRQAEALVRAYDPCIPCAVHVVRR